MGCCGIDTVGGRSAGGGGGGGQRFAELEIDFSAEPSAAIVTGNNVIAGLAWEGQAVAGQIFELEAANGLRFGANASPTATNYNFAGTTTAAFLRLPLATLWGAMDPAPDATWRLEVTAYASTISLVSNSCYFLVGVGGVAGVPLGSNTRGAAAMRLIANGVQCFKSRGSTASDGPNYQVAPDVVGVVLTQDGPGVAVGGAWAGAWPRLPWSMLRPSGSTQPYLDANSHVVLAFATNSSEGDIDVTLERMRVRAWGSPP